MPRYITLNLVNEEGTPHPWPGTPTQHEIGTQQSATAVWIGVSADGNNNQVYPLNTAPATILASWPHLYQGVQLNTLVSGDDSPATVGSGEFVYYVSLEEFNRLEAACCIASSILESPTPPEPEMLSFFYIFNNNGGSGTLVITADGDEVLNISANAQGIIEVPQGSDIVATADGDWDHSVRRFEGGVEVDQSSDTAGAPAILTINDVAAEFALLVDTSAMPPE